MTTFILERVSPRVSVVMPVLNEERHLADSVRMVLGQDWPGELEVVLALGPSHDRTDAVAADLAGEELVRTAQALPGGWWPVTGLPAPAILAEEDVRRAVTGALAAGSRSRGA